jgi:hypothetical protein
MDNSFTTFISLYFQMWAQPRKTIRHILDNEPGYKIWIFVVLYAIAQAWLPIFYAPFVDYATLDMLVLAGIVISLAIDIAAFYYFSGMGTFLGRLMGGKGSFKDIQTAYAWAYPPACVAIVLLQVSQIPTWFALIGGENHILTLITTPQDPWQDLLRGLSLLLNFWTFILLITNLSEAHRISFLRSFVLTILVFVPMFFMTFVVLVLLIVTGLISRGLLPPMIHFP